ncbi:stage III sporulation protein AF [Sporomusa acidovorans]|uniref:Stage III sporulation protein AF n=1 Tax=Sporomusa acidovorans (strain ATCC 49682 / DSM 3132 / Mol) TaxID=1123286 RepID=A0ABZ3J3C6_SPOA4|nr:stage III sporulation protein AF [Sporomusa acidovorans]OZC20373.1 stage III sporulation protein SpoIIIAF [Sporomusa acidovorans DSM 3132]SDD36276.1 stage III sporulation protein AF [Sporomusa acidovorans]
MIAYITVWIKNIIFVVLFASFLELLLPSNSMQRFVRVIIGLFIMLAILNPVIDVIESKTAANQLPVLATGFDNEAVNTDILNAVNHVAEKRDLMARDLYIRDLSKQIRATVMAIDGVKDAKVTISLEPATASLSKIKNIVIYIEPGTTAEKGKIAKIAIGNASTETVQDSGNLPVTVVEKTKKTVAELYQLKTSQIDVKRMKEGKK